MIVINSIAEFNPVQNLYLEYKLVGFDIFIRVPYLVIFCTYFLEFWKKNIYFASK